MKISGKIASVLLCVGMILLAVSCSSPKTEEKPKTDNQQQTEQQKTDTENLDKASQSGYDWAKIPEYPSGYPTQDDIISVYKTAGDAFKWFTQTGKPPIDENSTYDKDGITYFKVRSAQVTNLETLRVYLETLFGEDVVDLLMDYNSEINRFIENENGELFVTNFSFKPTGFGDDETYEVTKNSDDSYTLAVNYQLLNDDGSVKADRTEKYQYQKVAGRWIFTEYRVFRQ